MVVESSMESPRVEGVPAMPAHIIEHNDGPVAQQQTTTEAQPSVPSPTDTTTATATTAASKKKRARGAGKKYKEKALVSLPNFGNQTRIEALEVCKKIATRNAQKRQKIAEEEKEKEKESSSQSLDHILSSQHLQLHPQVSELGSREPVGELGLFLGPEENDALLKDQGIPLQTTTQPPTTPFNLFPFLQLGCMSKRSHGNYFPRWLCGRVTSASH